MKLKEKIFLNNVDITRDVQGIEISKDSVIFCDSYSITLSCLYRKAEYILQLMSYVPDAENLLEYQYLDETTGKQKTDCYYFRRRFIELTSFKEDNEATITLSASTESFIDSYINKIEELEDEIQKLKKENFKLKENIYDLEEITGLEVGLPPRIPIGESSSKEKENKDMNLEEVFFEFYPKFLLGGTLFSMFVFFVVLPLRILILGV